MSEIVSGIGIVEILDRLPHAYPFALLDRVLEHEPGERVVALKNVTYNEPFFPGHFPEAPVMPGVLILEVMAQATGILAMGVRKEETRYYIVGVDKARFRRPVAPGDQLIVEIRRRRSSRGVWKVDAEARVDDEVAATAELMGAIRAS